ncbi:caspase family protein [Bradyrhizobium japonicum]|uniref:caspase family protein n=1 Tax=Bradyrhizobium japonicum TaxID=375 RepID=UPI001BAAFAC7|nr:caspase family protein [Bradyrhizobium japonicum]MBR0750006.1 caspase family protein [Bradyrhizobium japonicum]
MRILAGLILISASLWQAGTSSSYAQGNFAAAWKLCQSSDAEQRIAGCSTVISLGGGGSKARLADALDGRCWAYHVKELYDLAVADCKASILLRPDYSYSYNNLASALVGQKKYGEAIAAANKSIELKPKFVWSHLNLARSLAGLGQNERALIEYQTALSLDPNNADAKTEAKALLAKPASPAEKPTEVANAAPELLGASGASPSKATVSQLPASANLATEPRVALVIGNASYRFMPGLQNPKSDAVDVEKALRELGFQTVLALDQDRAGMNAAIDKFSRLVPGAGVAVVYYSGHGMQFAGKNYLLPVDANLDSIADVNRFRLLALDDLMDLLGSADGLQLVVLDACRNNPVERSFKSKLASIPGGSRDANMTRGFSRIDAKGGLIITYATAPDEVASDGVGRNSPFTEAFLKNLAVPDVEIRQMLFRVQSDVYLASAKKQRPEVSSLYVGPEIRFRTSH